MIINATTADAIADRVIDLIEAVVPEHVSGTRFRRYRGEGDGDFVPWCEANPESAFRRVQVRHAGTVGVPEVSNHDFAERLTTINVVIAYPNDARTGRRYTTSRDTAISSDLDKLELAIGLYSRANFTSPQPDAYFRDWSTARVPQAACTYLMVDITYAFKRELNVFASQQPDGFGFGFSEGFE